MAKRLTEQEQAAIVALAKLLGKELPVEQRSNAGGIASGLVRLRRNPLSAQDVHAVLEKYGAGSSELEALLAIGVLANAVDDAGYTLSVPDAGSGPQAIAKTERPKPPARRDSRALSHLDTVRKQTPELNDIRRRIIDLDPRLWINGWLLSTPDAFVRYERELHAIDVALSGRGTLGDGSLSQRELSYAVFGDEKFLSPESDGRRLLHLMGLTDALDCRSQPKMELLHHIPKHRREMRLVVSENLDPWFNMRNAMFLEGRKRILGEHVHGVVFGNGYLVDDPHKLPDLLATLGAEKVEVLYWGDLDRAGLQILSKLTEMAQGRFDVRPFAAAYRLMLKRAMARFPNPLDNEETDQGGVAIHGLELLEPCLKKKEFAYLCELLDGARLVPQEILTARDL